MSRALKPEDILELSKLYESEFNNPDIHDRVLIFDVVALWPSPRPESEGIKNEAGSQSEDACDADSETIKGENVQEIGVNTSNENETGIHDGYNHDLNVTQETDMKLSNETEDNDIKTTTDENNATPEIVSESNEAKSYPTTREGGIIRQHKFYIHSTWLAVQSSYFRSLFFGGMKESSSTEVHIQISESEEQAHLMLLEAMYKIDALDKASVDELLEVLKLAHKYDVKVVFKKAKYCLQAAVVSLDICEKIMGFIKVGNRMITDVEDLASTLQSFLAKEFSPLDKTWETTSFSKLSEPSLRYLLSSNELGADSENTIFHALMYWIEQHGIEDILESKEMPSLLSTVRFELISIDYLYNIVQHDAVAKKFPDFHNHYLRGISYHAMSDGIRETLHNQPVKRKGIPGPAMAFIPYTWVIPRYKLDALVETDEELKSDEFWYCGYRIVLTISDVKKHDNYSNKERFNATVSLEITNLKQHSAVEMSWSVESNVNSFRTRTNQHRFKNDAHKSKMNICYQIEVNQSNNIAFPAIAAPPVTSFCSGFPIMSQAKGHKSGFSIPTTKPCSTTGFSFGAAATAIKAPPVTSFSSGFPIMTQAKGHNSVFSVPTTKPCSTTGFGFGTAPTFSPNTIVTSVIQESPDAPCLSIDVKMNLV